APLDSFRSLMTTPALKYLCTYVLKTRNMPPPEKKNPAKSKTILQTYLDSFEQEDDEEPTTVIAVNGSGDEADTGVTYFVDEEGRYYYQQSGDDQNLVSLPTERDEENAEISQEAQMLVDGEGYQTVTFVPSEGGGAELSYVLVMPEEVETKSVLSVDIKVDKVGFFCWMNYLNVIVINKIINILRQYTHRHLVPK
ncbi:jg11974, partial [Pararge aegeria aegeria]